MPRCSTAPLACPGMVGKPTRNAGLPSGFARPNPAAARLCKGWSTFTRERNTATRQGAYVACEVN